ncbi:hypothetical protein CLF_104093 [Clonorchis sinensis]|uniref:Uncharacterized protein n=1 Tax=Clonorchis sinensis TaxID=79923 RepID=G7YAY7_CLOSI|nr:hypothetical protein CLF_104093 [Clonorchis sinensis]
MAGLKLEDPTVDVGDVEKYRLAFLMQFFVQHKRRFRFPRLRLQDLYQRVVKDTDATAFCDLVARILRFLNHGDPDVSIDTVDQALDRFTVDKRTSYRINVQRYRNGKPVHQLGAMARAALLDNLIESVYDEQPDFNFTSGFNSSNPVTGLSNGIRSTSGSTVLDSADPEGTSSLFNGSDLTTSDGGDFTEPEDVNVLIKAGQDAQGCSYYYMDDLRLYRERPQSGISSHWDVAVGPTGAQWQAFILSLSRNEKEYDLYCFLKQDLFELVKHSLDSYELHSTNSELDSNFLRAKEASELAELRRRKGLVSSRLGGDGVDGAKLTLTTASNLATNGPKSASPAFSGGHGACGIGNSSNTSSGAPLTPSSARTPTSAPPATASGYCLPSLGPADLSDLLPTSKTDHMQSSQCTNRSHSMCDVPPKMNGADVSDSPASHKAPELCVTQPSGLPTETTSFPAVKSESSEQLAGTPRHADTSTWSCPVEADITTSGIPATFNDLPSANDTSWSSPNHCGGKPLVGPRQPSQTDARINTSTKNVPIAPSNDTCNLPASPGPASINTNPIQAQPCLSASTASQPVATRQQLYTVDQSPNKDGQPLAECNNGRAISGPLRPVPGDPVDSLGLGDRQVPPGSKPPMGPATALVPPMVGMPDGGPALTQEQWENRKSKIAQLEKIHSTLSKSKSASTPGAVAAAAGVVLQQQQQQQRLPPNGPAMPTEFAQIPPSITHQSTGLSSPVGFGPSPYPPMPRQVLTEGFPVNRLSGIPGGPPPNELAQREWDRICLDYQREKGEPPGPRFHPSARPPPSATAYDTSGCPLVQSDAGISSPGAVMIPSGHMSMDHPSCHAPQRHYPPNPDGPPVVMVPPNNSNLTGGNAPYPTPGSGPVPSASIQHFRSAHSMGHGCPDQSHACMLPTGQKRPYYGPYGDSWVPSNSGCMMGPLSSNDSSMYPGSLPPTGSVQPQRGSSLCQGSFGSTPPTSLPMVTAANVVTNSSNGRTSGVSKAGGKKRKAAAVTGRVSTVNTPATPTTNYQSQQQYAYGKQSGPNNSTGPMTPNKPPYSSMYMSDPSQAGFHRSAYASSPGQQNFGPPTAYPGSDPYFLHYPEPNMARAVGNSGLAIESRRALTPKGADSFAIGPAGYPLPYSATSGGRIPSNCGMPFSSPGSGSVTHPYMHSPDMPGPHCEMTPGLRPSQTGSCTQHLTSASLASLARLSQLSGSESPYVPSSASVGNSLGTIPGTGNYGGRAGLYHPDNVVVMSGSHPSVPPQAVRGLPGPVPMGLKPHDSELPPGAPSMHSKFTTQGYHGPTQQQHSGPAQPSLPQQQQQQQVQSQQPPSIQVNNTFFNAQLNVQQMNYQHVSAPGSTGQMQIHFVQQQQQHDQPVGTSGGGGGNARASRQTNPSSRMSVPPVSDYYPSQAPMGHATNYGPESGAVQRVSQFPNGASSAEFQVTKSDGPISTCASLPPSGVGPAATSYGNTSVQITPRTPHTIQYLPTVNPSQTELQQPSSQYPSAESAQSIRSKGLRSNVQYGSSDPTIFGHMDMPMPETMKQASFSSGTVYANQSVTQATSHQQFQQQQQQQQQQYGSQATFPSQPSNQGKNAPSHPLSARGSWVSSAEGHFDSNPNAGPPSAFHPGTVDAQLMSSGPVGRPSVHNSHPPSRINMATYPSGYSGDPMDQTVADSVPGSEVVGPGFQHRSSHPQYGRQSAPNKHESPAAVQLPPVQQQQHTYRHQQQQHYSQNAQQHQMFMSSSMGSLTPDGSGASNQVQFMMSASSTSSSLNASSTMQSTSTTLVTGDVSPMPTTANATSEATTVPSGGMCGAMASEMKLSQYDPIGSAKRAMLLPPTNDEIKPPGSLNGPSSFNTSSASQLSNRVSWQSNPSAIAAIPNNHSTLDQQHLVSGGSYATSYSSTAYATTVSSNSGTGQSTGFVDALGGGIRDVIGHSQAANTCDLPPPGLSQPPYPSSIVQ